MKNYNYLFGLFIFIGLFSFSWGQDFHTSTTKVEYENGSLKLMAKFFTDDLEKAVGASVNSKDSFDARAKAYTGNKLSIRVNGTAVPLVYVGFQTNDKSTRLYYKVDNVKDIKELDVTNSMLIELFPDQQNLVTFDVNGVRKSFTAKKGGDSGKLSF